MYIGYGEFLHVNCFIEYFKAHSWEDFELRTGKRGLGNEVSALDK